MAEAQYPTAVSQAEQALRTAPMPHGFALFSDSASVLFPRYDPKGGLPIANCFGVIRQSDGVTEFQDIPDGALSSEVAGNLIDQAVMTIERRIHVTHGENRS